MFNDIVTVARKELTEIVFPEGRFLASARNVVVLVGIAGIWFPLQAGTAWFESWATVGSACFPLLLVLTFTMDAFAGERERHTLETLLATRLDAPAILIGKTMAIVLYGWGLVLSAMPLGVVAVNLAHRGGPLLFFRPAILVSILAFGFLGALSLCAIGAVVSLAAPTARVAGQRMLVPLLAIASLPFGAPYLLERAGWQYLWANLHPAGIAVLAAGGLLAVAAIALAVGLKRFDRDRLVLA